MAKKQVVSISSILILCFCIIEFIVLCSAYSICCQELDI